MEKKKKDKLNEDWSRTWGRTNILREIGTLKRDLTRPYVLKYLPRNGTHIEAGCGLGRCCFYLSDIGFNIVGLDISKSGLCECKKWADENGYNSNMFKDGDVRDIPYPDNYFSSYLSFGVIEHFKEGPHKALNETYRLLRGGGVAVISTPNRYAYDIPIRKVGIKLKSIIAKTRKDFYQYEFSVNELANFIKGAGFEIIEKKYYCLKWPLYNISLYFPGGLNILRMLQPIIFPVLDFLEKTPLNLVCWGSLIVALKPSNKPHCFFCGEVFDCKKSEAHDFLVPICEKCMKNIPDKILSAYKSKNKSVFFESRSSYRFSKSQLAIDCKSKKEICFFCGEPFDTNKYFSDYGFSVPACQKCLKNPLKNLELSNYHLKYAWFEM